ncbi:hypothetical protein R6G85_04655 [Actinotignum urinale]|uniref:hypothetical protein n=1 Tax=Actinotignum urinale TaxID=190146 RepID=UPI002A80FBF2|nr:hypothetical protein [Actinotignum urinale]MDY5151775.1 hypothetical protein [Actinotignum urinale]
MPKSESAPKSDSKSKSAPAPSSPAARSDEEVGGGANEEVDDEATVRTGKVRVARSALTFHSVTGWVADPGDVSANSTCTAVYVPAREKRPDARPDESGNTFATAFDFIAPINSDVTVYVKWEKTSGQPATESAAEPSGQPTT